MAYKEALHLLRDPRTLVALVLMPAALLLLYGFALTLDVENVPLAVVDEDNTQASRELVSSFAQADSFQLVAQTHDARLLDAWFDSGFVQAALVIPRGYQERLHQGQLPPAQFLVDGSDARTATALLAYAQILARSQALKVAAKRGRVVARPLVWYNPTLRSSIFLVPGLLAFILMITTAVATALAVVREQERNTLESLRVTPLTASELILGKTIPYLFLGFLAAGSSLALAHSLFAVPLRGSLLSLGLVVLVFLLGGLGWGLFLSSVAGSQQVAFQMALLTTMLPTLLLSGFIFPISSMPKPIQLVTYLVPARYFLVCLRGITLKGTGFSQWWPHFVALTVFAVAILSLAVFRQLRRL
jgi:ABC-2 type transport system permease protein